MIELRVRMYYSLQDNAATIDDNSFIVHLTINFSSLKHAI